MTWLVAGAVGVVPEMALYELKYEHEIWHLIVVSADLIAYLGPFTNLE